MDDHILRPHGHNLHIGRVALPDHVYLVTTVTHQQLDLFSDFHIGRLVIRALRHQHDLGIVNSLGFVLMPDHLHWLFHLGPRADIARVMAFTKAMSTRRINARLNTPGRKIWQSGFHNHALHPTKDLRDLARCMVAKPLRAGLVSRIGDYPLWDAVWL